MDKIAVTGIGVVSPLGCDAGILWENLVQGNSGISPVDALEGLSVTFGGRAKDFDPSRYLGQKELRHLDLYAQMAITSGLDAYSLSRITSYTYPENRIGVLVGTGAGGISSLEQQIHNFNTRGPRRVSPLTVPMFIPNIASGVLSQRIGAKGPGMGVSSACATGGHAISIASRLIQTGDADCMLAGGVEACLTPFGVTAFANMKALSVRNNEPSRASRPFDKDRDGFVISEGGAVLVLERYTAAKQRGARVYGVLSGFGMTQDAYHMVAPDPEGHAVVYAMDQAIKDAGVSPRDIGYINAHGTSTLLNDKIETLAIKKVFKDHADSVRISSTKSMTGHLIGGASSLEAVICMMAMENGVLPPTINLENPDPECDLDYIPNKPVNADVSCCMNNSFGFGGQNVSMVVQKDL